MKKIITCLFFLLLLRQKVSAQETTASDSSTMEEVVITAYELKRAGSCGTMVKVINNNNADRSNKTSLVNGFNSIAGVRMEERSPGSYRLNIRGSSLRSPFGVRNVKVYWNDIPVTDAGGNTYFNQFAYHNFSYIEIIKGPAGSMYGAGTGGAVLMHSFQSSWKPSLQLEYIAASYGLQNILSSVSFGEKYNRGLVTFAHNESDGYRMNSKSKKDNLSYAAQFKISAKQQLNASVLYSNLYYQTPGGLTQSEFIADPKQARPAAGGLPSAAAAKAAIYQKNFLAGISHQYQFSAAFKNTTTLYGAFAQIQNPTFRNYERRKEPGFGGTTNFVYEKNTVSSKLQIVAGGELQKGFFNTQVSKNKNGNPDTLQTDDDIGYDVYSIFAQAALSIHEDWFFTTGASINKTKVGFSRLNNYPVLEQERIYKNEISPRLAMQKKAGKNAAIFASIARGFSPPSISELLPSTGVISTFLEAEHGVNYELGTKLYLLHNALRIDITGFYFRLNNALVTRKDSANADYFVNAGNALQKGMELNADYTKVFNGKLLDYLTVQFAYTFSYFKYGDFKKGTTDFSGRYLPSVPKNSMAVLADLQLKKGIYFNSSFYTAGKIFLDDANTVAADTYHLLDCRIGWTQNKKAKLQLGIYAGTDNVLNEVYSLGNDINATAGRYYNSAAKRNYYTGISFRLNNAKKSIPN